MSVGPDEHVRFYFGISVLFLIPPAPHLKRSNVSEERWEDDYLDKLRVDIEDKLSREGLDVAYRKRTLIDAEFRLYAVDFVVPALHLFPAVQLFTARRGPMFRVKTGPFTKVKTILEGKIAGALRLDYVVKAITYEYAASRFFTFEEYLEGVLRIERVFPRSEITGAGGGVREVIEQFNNEISDYLQPHGWNVLPKTTARRPKDNVYEFELSATKYNLYAENQVCGSLVLLEKDMPADGAANLGIDTIDPSSRVADNETELRDILDAELPYTVIELAVNWVDYDEEVYDIENMLI